MAIQLGTLNHPSAIMHAAKVGIESVAKLFHQEK
jgi:hypothetical protein